MLAELLGAHTFQGVESLTSSYLNLRMAIFMKFSFCLDGCSSVQSGHELFSPLTSTSCIPTHSACWPIYQWTIHDAATHLVLKVSRQRRRHVLRVESCLTAAKIINVWIGDAINSCALTAVPSLTVLYRCPMSKRQLWILTQ
jgi:hypothetical protein